MNRKLKIGLLTIIVCLSYIFYPKIHNILFTKMFFYELDQVPHTRSAYEKMVDKGFRLVSYAKTPRSCATNIEYMALVVINPHNESDLGKREWDSRANLEKEVRESCEQ